MSPLILSRFNLPPRKIRIHESASDGYRHALAHTMTVEII